MSTACSLEPVNMLSHTAKGTFANVINEKDLDVGRLSWIIQVGSILSHEPLKMENLFWTTVREMGRWVKGPRKSVLLKEDEEREP